MRPTRSRARGTSRDCPEALPEHRLPPRSRAPGRDPAPRRAATVRPTRGALPRWPRRPTATSANATSTPAASGPRSVPRLSIVEVAPFAAISSLAVRASDGSSATRPAGTTSSRHRPQTPAAKTTIAIVQRGPRGRDDECRRSEKHDCEQEPLAPEAVAQGRCERRDGGRREQAHETGDPDRRRSAVVVREHAEGDEVRPLGAHGRAPGQLRAANVGVSSRHAKGGERLVETRHVESQPYGRLGWATYLGCALDSVCLPPADRRGAFMSAVVQSRAPS